MATRSCRLGPSGLVAFASSQHAYVMLEEDDLTISDVELGTAAGLAVPARQEWHPRFQIAPSA